MKQLLCTPVIRLAHVPGMQGDNCLLGLNGIKRLPEEVWPALLISYVYLDKFLEKQSQYAYRDWMMDSGAFTAYHAGYSIDINRYIEVCHKLLETDKTLIEIISLDIIGSGEGSLKNAEIMRASGLEVIPVFHIGEDWEILKEYCKGWNKVGISCRFGEPWKKSYWFYDQCFAKCWPHKFHSFGWADEKVLMKYPFHSSDSSSWELQPVAFGMYKGFGHLPIRGSNQNLRTQVEWYLRLEEKIRDRWKKEMAILNSKVSNTPQSIRLVVGAGRSVKDVGISALNRS